MAACLLYLRSGHVFSFIQQIAMAAVCVIPVFAFLIHCFSSRTIVRIDISGTGQIRLIHYKQGAHYFELHEGSDRTQYNSEIVRLRGDSTLWPYYLSVRLQSDSGRVHVVPVLRDSVDKHIFRTLLVALRCVQASDSSSGSHL